MSLAFVAILVLSILMNVIVSEVWIWRQWRNSCFSLYYFYFSSCLFWTP